ncbi:hypothetical protein ACVXHA_27520 [Escherichia coli]
MIFAGEQGQQALLAWLNRRDTQPINPLAQRHGRCVRGWVSSIGKAVTAKESDHPHGESHQRGPSMRWQKIAAR